MSDLFYDAAQIDYPIIDSDAHVNEPPELWQDSVPAHLKDRAPKVEKTDKGDIWVFDGGREKWPVGLTATAGQSYAQVMYPSVTLKGAKIYSEDAELQKACVRAYNDWIVDFCKVGKGRLVPQAIMLTTGLADSLEELERAMKAGHKGAVISSFPNGTLDPKDEDDKFWAVCEEADFPVVIHIGSFLRGGGGKALRNEKTWSSLAFVGKAAWTKAGGQTLGVVCDLLFSGIFEKHPNLKIVLVESNIGWAPTLLEQADDMFRRYRFYTGAHKVMSMMPSEIFHRNFYATFLVDTVGMDLRHRLNIDHLMWSTDYPHSASDWPDSRLSLEKNFRGIPKSEVYKMTHENCIKLYKMDDIPKKRFG